MGILAGTLAVTTGLLALLSPAPLAPDVSGQLFAVGETARSLELEAIFRPRQRIEPGRWTAIYVHSSHTTGGDTSDLADQARVRGILGPPDHFVIGNGQGMGDGDVQYTARWDDQAAPALPDVKSPGKRTWISIRLIGQNPTQSQQERLAQLVRALQDRLGIPRVILADAEPAEE